MWYLTEVKTGKLFFLRGEKISVGRIADLILDNDKSVSRVHAYLEPREDHVLITDAESKYGTFINDGIEKIEGVVKGVANRIEPSDRIMFGRFENEWVLSKLNFKTITSLLPDEKKLKLVKILKSIGSSIVEKWEEDTTHLTMPLSTTATIKLLHALAACIPIVTPKFWIEVTKSISQNEPLPDYTAHMPSLSEPFLETVSLKVNLLRRTIFTDKTFVFMSNTQMESFREIITLAGGACFGLRGKKFKKELLLDNKYVAIQYIPSAQTQLSQSYKLIEDLKTLLTKNRKRFVPDVEIGLAILHCSTAQHCNTDLKFEALWKSDEAAQLIIQKSKVLVPESEEPIVTELEVSHLNISATQSQIPGPSNTVVSRQPTVYAENTEPPVQKTSVVPTIEIPDSADEEMNENNSESQSTKRKPSQNASLQPSSSKRARIESIIDNDSDLEFIPEEQVPSRKTICEDPAKKVANAFEKLKSSRIKPVKKLAAKEVPSVEKPTKKVSGKVLPKKTAAKNTFAKSSSDSDEEVTFNFRSQVKQTQAKKDSALRKSPEPAIPSSSASSRLNASNVRPNQASFVAPRVSLNPRNKRIVASDDDDEELFAFTSKRPKKNAPIESQTMNESASFRVNSDVLTSSLSTSSYLPITSKTVPKQPVFNKTEIKTSFSGPWLCKKMGDISIKVNEEEIKKEVIEDLRDEKTLKWIATMKDGFRVNEVKVDINALRSIASPFNITTNTVSSSGKKNFKTFVKKINYKQQTKIVRTHPVVVSMDL